MKKNIWISLSLALCATIFFSAFFPSIHCVSFAPFLIFLFFDTSFITCLFCSLGCGFFLDIISSSQMGIYSISYVGTTLLLYHQKKLFNDKALSICLFSFLFSLVFNLLHLILFFVFIPSSHPSKSWFLKDLPLAPFFDLIYTFLWFICPLKGIEKIGKIDIVKLKRRS